MTTPTHNIREISWDSDKRRLEWSGTTGTCSWWATQLQGMYHLCCWCSCYMLLLYLQPRDGVSFTKVILCGNKGSLFSLSRHWQIQCQWRILVLSRACTFKPVRYCTAKVSQFEEISDASSIHINSLMQCDELHAPFGFHFSNCSLNLPSKLHSPRLSCWLLLPPVARCNWHLSVA